MKYALTFTKHGIPPSGPIARSLFQFAERSGVPLRFVSRDSDWDEFDVLIWFHNRPPKIKTSAKVCWWMCDARTVEKLSGTADGIGFADYIFLCTNYNLEAYSSFYQGKAFYLPQCGDDTAEIKGRTISTDCVFIGGVPKLKNAKEKAEERRRARLKANGVSVKPYEINKKPLDPRDNLRLWRPGVVEEEHYSWAFGNVHANRLPIMHSLRQAGVGLSVIEGERTTVDQKYIYRTTPISLAISPQIPGYTSNRLYNILASSGFCLTLKFPGIENLFENHKHLVWYESPEEAVELIKFYTKNSEARRQIAESGHSEYLNNHTAEARITHILKTVRDNE